MLLKKTQINDFLAQHQRVGRGSLSIFTAHLSFYKLFSFLKVFLPSTRKPRRMALTTPFLSDKDPSRQSFATSNIEYRLNNMTDRLIKVHGNQILVRHLYGSLSLFTSQKDYQTYHNFQPL